MQLAGNPRVVNGRHDTPKHRLLHSPVRIDSMHGGSLILILDLGVAINSRIPIQVDLTDTHGTVTLPLKAIGNYGLEDRQETGWVGGTAHRMEVDCPPRGFPLSDDIAVAVVLGETRVRVGHTGDAQWVIVPDSEPEMPPQPKKKPRRLQ